MTAIGLFEHMRTAGLLRSTQSIGLADMALRLLVREQEIGPIGRRLKNVGIEHGMAAVTRAWTAHHGERRDALTSDIRPWLIPVLVQAMSRVAHEDGRFDEEVRTQVEQLLPMLDLQEAARGFLTRALLMPPSASDIVRSLHTTSEVLVTHLVALAVRGPDPQQAHALHAPLQARLKVDENLLQRLRDEVVQLPDHAIPRSRGRPGSPPGHPGAD